MRSVANASLEFAANATSGLGAARNEFLKCVLPINTSSASAVFVLGAAASAMDRFTLFDDCLFVNAMKSGSTALTGAIQLAASVGGMVVAKNSTLVGDGSANWGIDATSLAQIYIDGAAPTAATSGLAVNPS